MANKKRLQSQICRVMGIIQLLSECKAEDAPYRELSASMVCDMLNALLPRTVCVRTIRRDLEALEAMGFVEKRIGEKANLIQPPVWYSLASPVAFREQLRRQWRSNYLEARRKPFRTRLIAGRARNEPRR